MKRKLLSEDQKKYFLENWESKSLKEWCGYFNFSRTALDKNAKELGISFACRRNRVSEETKNKISEGRKKWLKSNPEKHPWRNRDKFKSKPCEKVKEFLSDLGISYIPEFLPEIGDRAFSIDIALPDKKIAIEINGNQHYNNDGTLKTYYQERHDLLVAAGWNVFEIHYSACFNLEKWAEFVEILKNSEIVMEFDYFTYKPRKKIIKKCVDCGGLINKYSIRCKPCAAKIFRPRKVNLEDRPSKERLHYMLWNTPTKKIGLTYGVSDNTIAKWAEAFCLTKPPRGYWMSFNQNKIIDYQI